MISSPSNAVIDAFSSAGAERLCGAGGQRTRHDCNSRGHGPSSSQSKKGLANLPPGTGFLPPETGAPKEPQGTISPRRDRKSETTTREKCPAKNGFSASELSV